MKRKQRPDRSRVDRLSSPLAQHPFVSSFDPHYLEGSQEYTFTLVPTERLGATRIATLPLLGRIAVIQLFVY